jgi:hypothetical protein
VTGRLHASAVFIIIIGIQPLGRFGQRPELSQAIGVALVRCILGKFLGVGCHYFPPSAVLSPGKGKESLAPVKGARWILPVA